MQVHDTLVVWRAALADEAARFEPVQQVAHRGLMQPQAQREFTDTQPVGGADFVQCPELGAGDADRSLEARRVRAGNPTDDAQLLENVEPAAPGASTFHLHKVYCGKCIREAARKNLSFPDVSQRS